MEIREIGRARSEPPPANEGRNEGRDFVYERTLEMGEQVSLFNQSRSPVQARLKLQQLPEKEHPTEVRQKKRKPPQAPAIEVRFGGNLLATKRQGRLEESPLYLFNKESANLIPVPSSIIPHTRLTHKQEPSQPSPPAEASPEEIATNGSFVQPTPPSSPPPNAAGYHES